MNLEAAALNQAAGWAVSFCWPLFVCSAGVDMGEGATCDLYCLDTSTARWEPVRPGSNSSSASTPAAPAARSYHAMAAAGGKLYVFGGCGAAGRQADLWEFDPSAAAWRQLPGCPAVGPRGGSSMVAAAGGSKLLVLGGFNGAAGEQQRSGAGGILPFFGKEGHDAACHG